MPRDNAVTLDIEAEPGESSQVVEAVLAEQIAWLRSPPCGARLEDSAASDTGSTAFVWFYSAKVHKQKRDSDWLGLFVPVRLLVSLRMNGPS